MPAEALKEPVATEPVEQPAVAEAALGSEYDFDDEAGLYAEQPEQPAPAVVESKVAEPEAGPEESAAPETPAPKHPGWLLQQAVAAGISAEEANLYTPGELVGQMRLARVEAALAARNEESKTQPKEEEAAEDDPLDDPDLHPVLAKKLREQDARLKKLDAIEAELTAMKQSSSQRQAQEFLTQFDGWIGQLPAEVQAKVGADGGERQELLVTMDALNAGAQQLGKSLSAKQLFDRAVRTLHGDVASAAPAKDEAAEAELARRTKMFDENAGVAKPTQRAGKLLPKGDKRAEAAVREWQEANGLTSEQEKELVETFLP